MPYKLIVILVIFGIFLAFITLNLENKCDISFGFTVIKDIPVFITIFFSFSFGLLVALPYIIRASVYKKGKKNNDKEKKPNIDEIERNLDGGLHEIK